MTCDSTACTACLVRTHSLGRQGGWSQGPLPDTYCMLKTRHAVYLTYCMIWPWKKFLANGACNLFELTSVPADECKAAVFCWCLFC